MGNTNTNSNSKQFQMRAFQQQMSCQDDLMCKNIDAKRSTVDKMVLVCPNAKCLAGTCDCGAGCERDSYTGICCTRIEKDANGNSYCIEEPYKEVCNVPNQTINGVTISGKQICDLYNQYQNQKQ